MRTGKILLPALLVCALAITSGRVIAQQMEGSVLFVAPHRLIVEPTEKTDVIAVSNKSDTKRRYDLMLIDQVMNENGITQRKDTYPYSVKKMVKFVPRRFTLEPGQRQTVRIAVNRPKDMADGDYHSHLLFREVPLSLKDKKAGDAAAAEKKVSFEIRTLYGIAVPIVVQKGAITAEITMGEPTVVTGENGRKQLKVAFSRTGNAEGAGKLSVEYVAGGKDPVEVADPQWVRIYREVDAITKTFNLNMPEGAAGGKLVLHLMRDENDESKTLRKEIAFN